MFHGNKLNCIATLDKHSVMQHFNKADESNRLSTLISSSIALHEATIGHVSRAVQRHGISEALDCLQRELLSWTVPIDLEDITNLITILSANARALALRTDGL